MPPAVHPQRTAKVILFSRAAESFSTVFGPPFCQQLSTFGSSSISLLCRDRSSSGSATSKENTGKGVPAIGALPFTHSVAIYCGPHSSHTKPPLESKQQALYLHPGNRMAASVSLLSGGLLCSTSISSRYNESCSSMMLGVPCNGASSVKYYGRVNKKWTDRCLFGRESIHRCFRLGASSWTLGKLKSSENPGIISFRSLCVSSRSAGSVPDVSYDGLPQEDQDCSATSSEQKAVDQKTLKLQSGSCYLPHPAKEASGGEDAHFICEDEQVVGVADGVGGWAEVGVNAGLYSRELMAYSVAAIKEEPKGSVNPSRVLEKAYSFTKAAGSSTACIIALTDQGIHAVNLGDSGFIVVRDGSTIFSSPVQQHDFNFTYQLGSSPGGDLPSSAQVFTFTVAPGDVIVAGSDGLFDNLFNNEITAVVSESVAEGLEPQATAQNIASLARERALDRKRQTPFSMAAQVAGYRFFGGKLDDLTVVVSYVTTPDS